VFIQFEEFALEEVDNVVNHFGFGEVLGSDEVERASLEVILVRVQRLEFGQFVVSALFCGFKFVEAQ